MLAALGLVRARASTALLTRVCVGGVAGMTRPPLKGRRSSDHKESDRTAERPPRTPLSATVRPASHTANMWDDADTVLGTGVVTPKVRVPLRPSHTANMWDDADTVLGTGVVTPKVRVPLRPYVLERIGFNTFPLVPHPPSHRLTVAPGVWRGRLGGEEVARAV